nr:hypothetical protein [Cellulomonas septica]
MLRIRNDAAPAVVDATIAPGAKHFAVPVPPAPEYTTAARAERFHTDFAVEIPVDDTDVLVVLANVPAYPVAPQTQNAAAAHCDVDAGAMSLATAGTPAVASSAAAVIAMRPRCAVFTRT